MLNELVKIVRYGGNPEHKKHPGRFGLTPPSSPRPGKTLCDAVEIFDRETAQKLLKEGIIKGLISEQKRGGFPQNVWVVTEEGIPLEAQLENEDQGLYHAYPMAIEDPFREEIFNRWEKNAKK